MAKRSVSAIEQASNRLGTAFARLEQAIALQVESGGDPKRLDALNESWSRHCEALEADIHSLRSENADLREENVRLSNQLQQLQQDYLELRELADSVASTLDKKAQQLELLG